MGQYVSYDNEELLNLNNFFAHFPFGDSPYEQVFPLGLYRNNLQDHWNITAFEFLQGMREFASDETVRGYLAQRSDKRLAQTPAQFYAEVDTVVKHLGMSLEDVTRKINVYLHDRDQLSFNQRNDAMKLHFDLCEYLTPIYIALRKSGYNPQDLSG